MLADPATCDQGWHSGDDPRGRDGATTMSNRPSPNGTNGRGAGGRFAKGNAGGPGNPYAKRVGQLRSMLLDAVTDEDWLAAIHKLIDDAKSGDKAARRELFERMLGKPVEADLVERLERLEELADKQQEHRP